MRKLRVWRPVKGPVIVELGKGALAIFREDSAEGLGVTEDYPEGFKLCSLVEVDAGLPEDIYLTLVHSVVFAYQSSWETKELDKALTWLGQEINRD